MHVVDSFLISALPVVQGSTQHNTCGTSTTTSSFSDSLIALDLKEQLLSAFGWKEEKVTAIGGNIMEEIQCCTIST